MYKVEFDLERKEVYLAIKGMMKKDEALAYKKDVKAAFNKFFGKVNLLVDLRESLTHTQEAMEIINETRDENKKKVKKSAVISEKLLVKMQARRTMQEIEDGFEERYFGNEDEALEFIRS